MGDQEKIFWIIGLLAFVQLGFFGYAIVEFEESKALIAENTKLIQNTEQKLNFKIDAVESDLSSSISSTKDDFTKAQEDLQGELAVLKSTTSADFSGIIEEAINSVVTIKTNVAQGTGFLITNDGYVVTNAHVLQDSSYANAITANHRQYSMILIGYNGELDVALLKINGEFESLEFGDSNNLKVGEKVIAIGNPKGLSFSVTEGIISAFHRKVSGYDGEYIQTDAALNQGNSGGPLINTQGKVIGINNFKIEGDNIGLALESNIIVEEINRIAQENLNQTLI